MASDLEVLQLEYTSIETDKRTTSPQYPQVIQRFQVNDLSYNEFYWTFMENNWPVILCDVSSHWDCRKSWIKYQSINDNNTSTTSINYDYLKERIGNCQVPVANCNKEYFNSHAKSEMLFYDFLNYWKHKRGDGDIVSSTEISNIDTAANNITTNTTDLLYLKDWHLKSQQPDYDFYKVPKHFACDWLNEHLVAAQCDDYRFVYMGPRDTWTPFHSDVFGSFSWSTNIMGIKKWLLLPPSEEQKLCDRLGNLPFRIDEQLLDDNKVDYYTVMQKENESLFVPSGWYHQVCNVTDTISVNHNWFNACNLERIWLNLSHQMQKVIAEIDDCRQMDNFMEHCQTMLRASFGINYLDFLELLKTIADKRCANIFNNNSATNVTAKTALLTSPPLNSSQTTTQSSTTLMSSSSKLIFFDHYTPNNCHVYHDLRRILQVVDEMLQDTVICDDRIVLYRKCILLKETILSST